MHPPLKSKFLTLVYIKLFILFFGLKSFGQAPAISSFAPATVCQGDSVTITGENFKDATAVRLGTADAISFKIKDDKTIIAYTGKDAKSGDVSVTNSKGTGKKPGLTINEAPHPELHDASTVDIPFTNCNGNSTYQLTVKNISSGVAPNSVYDIDWGDGTAHFNQKDWAVNAATSHNYNRQGYF
jgi:hypothetical protein